MKWKKANFNAPAVVILIMLIKFLYSPLLCSLHWTTCPFKLRLTWLEATKTIVLIDCFNPFVFCGLLAFYLSVYFHDDCTALYSAGDPHKVYMMVEAQLFFQAPFMLYLYGGLFLLYTWRVLYATCKWMWRFFL